MITLITTFTTGGAANIGDLLIEESLRGILTSAGIHEEILTVFREDSLDPILEKVNASRAVLLPGFAIRDTPMYPGTYRLTASLSHLKRPLIPVGANYNVYPGDRLSIQSTRYSRETLNFLDFVAKGAGEIACREWHTCEVLERNGIGPTTMIGDPAWYHLPSLGKRLKRPGSIKKIVFTPPLSGYYSRQAVQLIEMLAETFPAATRLCANHLKDSTSPDAAASDTGTNAVMSAEVARKNALVANAARKYGFRILDSDGTTNLLSEYDSCDLHVGYECHAHIAFLRKRIPSVLIHEDARGVGYSYTLGNAGFDGFIRAAGSTQHSGASMIRKRITSGYATTQDEIALASPREGLADMIRRYIIEEIESDWTRLSRIPDVIDRTYEKAMEPFIRAVFR
ncbi:MAG: polysaccharide pyruvyl transferase family protein [Spirochaetales bacterium]|jgi:hypothetical protein|nr:polysaccharide pyruvyl transferase family protein [Spirochaetales bacterium]